MMDSIVAEPNQGIVSTLEIPEATWFFQTQVCDIAANELGQLAAVLRKEMQRLEKFIREQGIRID